MSHEDIKAAVDGMNGGSLRASAEGWTKIGESLQQALNDFRDFITTETDGKWEGVAKDSATAATGRYATESGKLAEAGTLIGTKITEAATGVDQVKATVPPVSKRSLLEVAFDAGMPTAGLFKRLVHDQDEAHQEAIQIMRTVYTPVMQQADTNVPRLPEPPRVIAEHQGASPSSVVHPASARRARRRPTPGDRALDRPPRQCRLLAAPCLAQHPKRVQRPRIQPHRSGHPARLQRPVHRTGRRHDEPR
ncbi:PPE domain-containing protein [Rhodococcus hoagii]|nr:PPE domain-containing protein [Prescottella equi]